MLNETLEESENIGYMIHEGKIYKACEQMHSQLLSALENDRFWSLTESDPGLVIDALERCLDVTNYLYETFLTLDIYGLGEDFEKRQITHFLNIFRADLLLVDKILTNWFPKGSAFTADLSIRVEGLLLQINDRQEKCGYQKPPDIKAETDFSNLLT